MLGKVIGFFSSKGSQEVTPHLTKNSLQTIDLLNKLYKGEEPLNTASWNRLMENCQSLVEKPEHLILIQNLVLKLLNEGSTEKAQDSLPTPPPDLEALKKLLSEGVLSKDFTPKTSAKNNVVHLLSSEAVAKKGPQPELVLTKENVSVDLQTIQPLLNNDIYADLLNDYFTFLMERKSSSIDKEYGVISESPSHTVTALRPQETLITQTNTDILITAKQVFRLGPPPENLSKEASEMKKGCFVTAIINTKIPITDLREGNTSRSSGITTKYMISAPFKSEEEAASLLPLERIKDEDRLQESEEHQEPARENTLSILRGEKVAPAMKLAGSQDLYLPKQLIADWDRIAPLSYSNKDTGVSKKFENIQNPKGKVEELTALNNLLGGQLPKLGELLTQTPFANVVMRLQSYPIQDIVSDMPEPFIVLDMVKTDADAYPANSIKTTDQKILVSQSSEHLLIEHTSLLVPENIHTQKQQFTAVKIAIQIPLSEINNKKGTWADSQLQAQYLFSNPSFSKEEALAIQPFMQATFTRLEPPSKEPESFPHQLETPQTLGKTSRSHKSGQTPAASGSGFKLFGNPGKTVRDTVASLENDAKKTIIKHKKPDQDAK